MEIMAIVKGLKALALSTAQIVPISMAVVEIVKRFLPNKTRDVANPVLAVVVGIISAYLAGGQQEVITVILQGFAAGGAAIGAYSIPKAIGVKMGIQ